MYVLKIYGTSAVVCLLCIIPLRKHTCFLAGQRLGFSPWIPYMFPSPFCAWKCMNHQGTKVRKQNTPSTITGMFGQFHFRRTLAHWPPPTPQILELLLWYKGSYQQSSLQPSLATMGRVRPTFTNSVRVIFIHVLLAGKGDYDPIKRKKRNASSLCSISMPLNTTRNDHASALRQDQPATAVLGCPCGSVGT